MFAPQVRVQQGPEWANMQGNQYALQSILGGIQEAQRQRAQQQQMAQLAQILQMPDPLAKQAALVNLLQPQQPQGGLASVLNPLNPFGQYQGSTGIQAGIANTLMGQALRSPEEIEYQKAKTNYMNRYSLDGEKSTKDIIASNKALKTVRDSLTDDYGEPLEGKEEQVAAIDAKINDNNKQLAANEGVELSSGQPAQPTTGWGDKITGAISTAGNWLNNLRKTAGEGLGEFAYAGTKGLNYPKNYDETGGMGDLAGDVLSGENYGVSMGTLSSAGWGDKINETNVPFKKTKPDTRMTDPAYRSARRGLDKAWSKVDDETKKEIEMILQQGELSAMQGALSKLQSLGII